MKYTILTPIPWRRPTQNEINAVQEIWLSVKEFKLLKLPEMYDIENGNFLVAEAIATKIGLSSWIMHLYINAKLPNGQMIMAKKGLYKPHAEFICFPPPVRKTGETNLPVLLIKPNSGDRLYSIPKIQVDNEE